MALTVTCLPLGTCLPCSVWAPPSPPPVRHQRWASDKLVQGPEQDSPGVAAVSRDAPEVPPTLGHRRCPGTARPSFLRVSRLLPAVPAAQDTWSACHSDSFLPAHHCQAPSWVAMPWASGVPTVQRPPPAAPLLPLLRLPTLGRRVRATAPAWFRPDTDICRPSCYPGEVDAEPQALPGLSLGCSTLESRQEPLSLQNPADPPLADPDSCTPGCGRHRPEQGQSLSEAQSPMPGTLTAQHHLHPRPTCP